MEIPNENVISSSSITKERLLKYRAQNPVKFARKFAGVNVDSMKDGEVLTRTISIAGVVTNVINAPAVEVDETEEEVETKPEDDKPKAKNKTK